MPAKSVGHCVLNSVDTATIILYGNHCHATPPQGEICNGTGSQFLCFGVLYLLLPQSARFLQLSTAIRWTIKVCVEIIVPHLLR